jgi:hypothetical protein
MSNKHREQAIGSSRHATVDALLDSFHTAAAKADLVAYFGCMDKRGRFLGTDATENWTAGDFYDFTKPYFASGKGWTYVPVAGSRKVTYYPGPSIEAAQFCTFDEILHNESFGTCRGSGTLVYSSEHGCWFVAAYHLNFPVPNDLAGEVTTLIKKGDPSSQAKQADAAAAQLLAELELADKGSSSKGGKKKKGKK